MNTMDIGDCAPPPKRQKLNTADPAVQCGACNKVYSTKYKLIEHMKRQPMCSKWIELIPGPGDFKGYINGQFSLPTTDLEAAYQTRQPRCMMCAKTFANMGNLNRHLDESVICSKWKLYHTLKPLQAYSWKQMEQAELTPPPLGAAPAEVAGPASLAEWSAPKHRLCHVIWNIFVIDKPFVNNTTPEDLVEIVTENNIRYVAAILPGDGAEERYAAGLDKLSRLGVEHAIMKYEGHDTKLDIDAFDVQCKKIELYRSTQLEGGGRCNVFVMCNSGYQRSLPFLCYYLTRYHPEEAPTIAAAIDLILPQVDRENYAAVRDKFVECITQLFDSNETGGSDMVV